MAGMAGSVGLFRKNIDGASHDTVKFDKTTQDVGRNIDKLSGRLGLLVDVAATLGPALIPTAAAAVPLIAGLTNQLGFAAVAGGTTILAFHGIGTALKAVNEQAINPSTENLAKMHEAMAKLAPAGRDFVRELESLRPELSKLQDAAQAGLFPGMTKGIESLTTRLPQAQELISTVADTLGTLMAKAGDSLAGPEWDAFFNMLQSEAHPTLMALGESIGQVTKGLADLWVAFTPLNRSFSTGMLEASRSFAQWADGLSRTQGFADFMSYLQSTGPKVAEALGAIGNAVLKLLEAAAPLGGPALKAITAFSNAVASIADSSLGTPIFAAIAAWRAYSMAVGLAEKAQLRFNSVQAGGLGVLGGAAGKSKGGGFFSGYTSSLLGVTSAQQRAQTAAGKTSSAVLAQRSAFLKGAAGVAVLSLATSGLGDKIGVTNTAMLGLSGFMVGGPLGAAIGGTIGGVIDLTHANDGLNDSLTKLSQMAGNVDFSTFNAQLADAQKKIDDMKTTTGVGDFISDAAKTLGATLTGKGLDGGLKDAQKKANAAQAVNDNAMRTRGAAIANAQMAASSQLAASGFKTTAAGAREASMSVQQFTFSMRGASAALARQSNWDSFRGAVLDAKDAVDKAGKTLAHNGDIIKGQGREMQRAGLESRGLLHNIAQQAITTSEGMKNIANRTKFLDGARDKFIGVARAMGASGPAARRMASELGLVDRGSRKSAGGVQELNSQIRGLKSKIVEAKAKGAKESSPEVQALRDQIAKLKGKAVPVGENGAAAARARIAALQAQINALHGTTITNTINTITHRSGYTPTGHADGGTVMGQRYPYGDKVHAFLAPGEEVITNRHGEADRFRADRAAGRIPHYADGGTVQWLDDGPDSARRRHHNESKGEAKDHETLRDRIRKLTAAIDTSTKSLQKESSTRDDLVAKRTELASAVGSNFTSDLFGQQPANLSWMNAKQKQAALTGSVFSTLKSDIANANTFKVALAGLSKRGLGGQAFAALAASGDIGRAQAFSHLSNKDLKSYQSLFNQRAAAAASVGSLAGNVVFNGQIAAQTKAMLATEAEIKGLRADLKRAQAKPKTIHVHDKSGNPHKTAKEISRRQAMG